MTELARARWRARYKINKKNRVFSLQGTASLCNKVLSSAKETFSRLPFESTFSGICTKCPTNYIPALLLRDPKDGKHLVKSGM